MIELIKKTIQKADDFDSMGSHDEAIKLYDDLIGSGHQNARIYALRGYSKFKAGYFKSAINDLGKAIDMKNDVPTTYFFRGRAKEEIGDIHGALDDYKKSAELEFDKFDVHLNMGMIYEYLGRMDEAEHEYRIALKIDPKNTLAIESLMEIKKNRT